MFPTLKCTRKHWSIIITYGPSRPNFDRIHICCNMHAAEKFRHWQMINIEDEGDTGANILRGKTTESYMLRNSESPFGCKTD
jgi:hypothetical protein